MTAPWAIPNRAWAVGIVWAQSSFGAGSRYPSCAAPLIFGMPISSCGAFQRCLGHGNRRGAICSLNTAGEFSCAHYDPGFQVCCCWNWAGFLLCALAILAVDKLKPAWVGFALASVLIAIAVSLYQAMFVVALSAVLVKYALQCLRTGVVVLSREGVFSFFAAVLSVIAGYGVHGLLTRVLMLALGLRDDPCVASILGMSAITETLGIRLARGSWISMNVLAGSASAFGASIPLYRCCGLQPLRFLSSRLWCSGSSSTYLLLPS